MCVVASVGPLSVLIFINLGNLNPIPFVSCTSPIPAVWTGDIYKSEPFISHTYFGSNQTSIFLKSNTFPKW